MKKFVVAGLIALATAVFWVVPVSAAPNENASHVAQCATQMGGQHVAGCAQTMDMGVSTCAKP